MRRGSKQEDLMARKFLMVAAVALVALTSSISVGTAQAHWANRGYYGWGYPGWGYPGWRYPGWGYRAWWPGYYRYPACYVTAYGTTACY
jgi:hypothetical protein